MKVTTPEMNAYILKDRNAPVVYTKQNKNDTKKCLRRLKKNICDISSFLSHHLNVMGKNATCKPSKSSRAFSSTISRGWSFLCSIKYRAAVKDVKISSPFTLNPMECKRSNKTRFDSLVVLVTNFMFTFDFCNLEKENEFKKCECICIISQEYAPLKL